MRRINRFFGSVAVSAGALSSISGRRHARAMPLIPVLTAIIALSASACFAQLTSNNITALAGSGDTLWIATERGLNYRTSVHNAQEVWGRFEESDFSERFRGLTFGDGRAAALLYKNLASDSIGFWNYSHATGSSQQDFFIFPRSVRIEDCEECPHDALANPTGHVVYAHGNFWASFNRGGIVRYNPQGRDFRVIRPGDENEGVLPQDLTPIPTPVSSEDSAKIVTGIGIHSESGFIIAVTPSKFWTYDPASRNWAEIDTLPANPIYDAIDAYNFRPKFEEAGDIATPKINDKLFMPRGADGTGTLAFATTTGLYLCEHANPLAGEYGAFELIRHVRAVKGGEAYALPGVIRSGLDNRYAKTVFVYKLKKDGNVTISVYDYRMSLVKTVIRGEARSAAAERSTVPARDFWDGTNRDGKRVTPGVYYFKITSTGGDRFLGKVILAK